MFSGVVCFLLLLSPLPIQTPLDSIQQHYEKAEALRRAGNLSAAEAEYTAILGEAYYKLGRVRLVQPDYSESVIALEAASAYRPDSNVILVDLAIAYFHLEQYEKALDPLRKAVARDPQNTSAHHMLGKTYFMIGDFERATVELQAALSNAPNDYDVAYTPGALEAP